MRRWKDLGMVETIYEADHEKEEDEEEVEEEGDTLSNPLSSLTLSPDTFPSIYLSSTPSTLSPSTPLQTIVDEWSKAKAYKSNVVIRVQGQCFHLHREPMSTWSRYLRRRLAEFCDVTVSPPLSITVEAFTDVARFCYGWASVLTPLNVAAIHAAAELLEIDEDGGGGGGGGGGCLIRQTEEFFRKEVAGNGGNAAEVLRACIGLLPEAGEAPATMAARCVEVLVAVPELVVDGGGGGEWILGLMEPPASVFRMIAESMSKRSVVRNRSLFGVQQGKAKRRREDAHLQQDKQQQSLPGSPPPPRQEPPPPPPLRPPGHAPQPAPKPPSPPLLRNLHLQKWRQQQHQSPRQRQQRHHHPRRHPRARRRRWPGRATLRFHGVHQPANRKPRA